ncbi:MAG: transposase [Bifidobacteriaceae bacterium]|jgi:hypothetical protein|nr:transposase [Bifidobacteriaceae bacterium]
MVDIDDSVIEVHGYAKQGAGRGYTGKKGLNMLLATATGPGFRPAVVAARLRKGSASSPKGAARLVRDALKLVWRTHLGGRPVVVRADSAFFGQPAISATLTGDRRLAKATTPTIRRRLVQVPARLARSARRWSMRLPRGWPCERAWLALRTRVNQIPMLAAGAT